MFEKKWMNTYVLLTTKAIFHDKTLPNDNFFVF